MASAQRKRPIYQRGIAFIARNDKPDETNLEVVETLLSVITLAQTYNITEREVATDVLTYRKHHPN